jgi:hypothetical protein
MSYEVRSRRDVVKPGPMELEQDEKFVSEWKEADALQMGGTVLTIKISRFQCEVEAQPLNRAL